MTHFYFTEDGVEGNLSPTNVSNINIPSIYTHKHQGPQFQVLFCLPTRFLVWCILVSFCRKLSSISISLVKANGLQNPKGIHTCHYFRLPIILNPVCQTVSNLGKKNGCIPLKQSFSSLLHIYRVFAQSVLSAFLVFQYDFLFPGFYCCP